MSVYPSDLLGSPAREGILILASPCAFDPEWPDRLAADGYSVVVFIDPVEAVRKLQSFSHTIWRRGRVRDVDDWRFLSAFLDQHKLEPPIVVMLQDSVALAALRDSGIQTVSLRLRRCRPSEVEHSCVSPSLAALADYRSARNAFEMQFILRVLEAAGGNVTLAARAMGIARRNLQVKIRKLGIQRLIFDDPPPPPINPS